MIEETVTAVGAVSAEAIISEAAQKLYPPAFRSGVICMHRSLTCLHKSHPPFPTGLDTSCKDKIVGLIETHTL